MASRKKETKKENRPLRSFSGYNEFEYERSHYTGTVDSASPSASPSAGASASPSAGPSASPSSIVDSESRTVPVKSRSMHTSWFRSFGNGMVGVVMVVLCVFAYSSNTHINQTSTTSWKADDALDALDPFVKALPETFVSQPNNSSEPLKSRFKRPPGPTTSSASTEDDNSRVEALRSGSLFCSVYVYNASVGQEIPVGFVEIENPKATFADLRVCIQAELSDLEISSDWNWRFLLPTLGPVSLRQELTRGPIQPLLKQTSSPPRDGSIRSPFKVFLVDAPKVR